MSMSLHQFYAEVADMALVQNWRKGQALFNHLLKVRPDLAESLRGTGRDPFYSHSTDDSRFQEAVAFIEASWDYGSDD